MKDLLSCCLLLCYLCVPGYGHGMEVVGYWQNWVDVSWWQNNIPGNCLMGCAKPEPFLQSIGNYSVINYGFTFLTKKPNPAGLNCSQSTNNCPEWGGKDIWIAAASKPQSAVLNASTTVEEYTPGLIAMAEVCRLARMAPSGPRRCKITLGGWSDWARIGSASSAQMIGELVAKMVLYTFADGIDLDFEHLTEYNQTFPNDDEFKFYDDMVKAIRSEFDKITETKWGPTIQARLTHLNKTYNSLPAWKKKEAFYYPTNIKYLQELATNKAPYLEISYTTRFNAFVDPSDPWNYLAKGSPVPKQPFATRDEGKKVWPAISTIADSINIMAYDAGSAAGALKLNFEQILKNFAQYGNVKKTKLNIGFEPGNQASGGVWEGLQVDETVARFVGQQGFGGVMIWAINPDQQVEPKAYKWCPIVAKDLMGIVKPVWPYGQPPKFTKCDPKTGWLPSNN